MSPASHTHSPRLLSGAARLGGVVGSPIAHSLSPRLHGAWLAAMGLDAAYVPLAPTEDGFERLIEGLRGGVFAGLNVTLPFKERALHLADQADPSARMAGAANLLLFHKDGVIEARNTDGAGLLYALKRQAPHWSPDLGPVTILGAGGAARGAVAALSLAGARDIRILNRTESRADAIAALLPCRAFGWGSQEQAFDGAMTLINATSGQLTENSHLPLPAQASGKDAVAMDMVYTPLRTGFLADCEARGFATVDGLDMLIGQARPSFEAIFNRAVPDDIDIRALLLSALERRSQELQK